MAFTSLLNNKHTLKGQNTGERTDGCHSHGYLLLCDKKTNILTTEKRN